MKRLFGLVVVGLLVAAQPPKKDSIEGVWLASSMEMGGMKMPDEQTKDIKLTFTADKVTLNDGRGDQPGSYKLDASKKPATIDITRLEGPEKGTTMKGIYELKGDTLKMAMQHGEGDRPVKFESKPDTTILLIVLKKKK